MDRIDKNFRFHPSMISPVKYGEKDSVPIDQQPAQRFNIDPMTGRPMSDITAILRAKGKEQDHLLENLTEFKATYLPDGISDEEALKYYKPRLCQMPSELAEYTEQVTRERLERDKKLKDAVELDLFKKHLRGEDEDEDEVVESN